jgi:hypothetical protein
MMCCPSMPTKPPDDLLKRRKPVLTAKRLLTNQTFRDIYAPRRPRRSGPFHSTRSCCRVRWSG